MVQAQGGGGGEGKEAVFYKSASCITNAHNMSQAWFENQTRENKLCIYLYLKDFVQPMKQTKLLDFFKPAGLLGGRSTNDNVEKGALQLYWTGKNNLLRANGKAQHLFTMRKYLVLFISIHRLPLIWAWVTEAASQEGYSRRPYPEAKLPSSSSGILRCSQARWDIYSLQWVLGPCWSLSGWALEISHRGHRGGILTRCPINLNMSSFNVKERWFYPKLPSPLSIHY